jgi:hypothetical protein
MAGWKIHNGGLFRHPGPGSFSIVKLPSGFLNIAMENDPFIDGLPIKNGDFPWLC